MFSFNDSMRYCLYTELVDMRKSFHTLIENDIRPLALGRKNWLFCGNNASAYRAAIVYSLLTSCRAADVNPRQLLEHVLIAIPTRRKGDQSLEDLLPMELPNDLIPDLGILRILTDINTDKHPQNSAKKPERWDVWASSCYFCRIFQYVLHSMLTNVLSAD